jgi:hypothetical protein
VPPESGGGVPPDGRRTRSGLRDPVRAVRGLGAGSLTLQALVLLLAIQPLRMLGGAFNAGTVGVTVALAVCALLLAGLLRRGWAWQAGTALQVALLLCGFLHWSLGTLGVIFGLLWAYVLHVRRSILG